MINAALTGFAANAPELKVGQNGEYVVFSVPVNYRDGSTLWIQCYVDGNSRLRDVTLSYITKGTPLFITGELRASPWLKNGEPQAGLKLYVSGIKLLSRGKGEADGGKREGDAEDGEIPF